MRGTWFGGDRVGRGAREGRTAASVSLPRCVCALVVALVGVLALGAGSAWAEPVCTDTWTGPSEGEWTNAEDWSTGKVPTSTSVACIGSGKTVKITAGTNETGVVQGEGTLVISGGSLEVVNTLEVSSIKGLALSLTGTLTGSGEVDVTGSFSASEGQLKGSGSTVIKSGASGSITSGSNFTIVKRTLINEASLTVQYPNGGIVGKEGAKIVNRGTLTINGEGETKGLLLESGSATLVNTGTVQKTEGTGNTRIGWEVDNEKTFTATTGHLYFDGGGVSGKENTGSWSAGSGAEILFFSGTYYLGSTASLSGTVKVITATVSAGKVEGSAASLAIEAEGCCLSGTMEITGPVASTLQNLTLKGTESTTLSGSGEVDVTGSFVVSDGQMKGSGLTVIKPGASGSVESGPDLSMTKRTLVNEGSLTVKYSEGGVVGKEGATIINRGIFTLNGQGEAKGLFAESPTPTPVLVNTGTVQKTEGTGTTRIGWSFENLGTIHANTGKFEITHPIVPEVSTQYGSGENSSILGHPNAKCGDPVSCATGNFAETQTDFAIGGRGVGLGLKRTYNSQAGAEGAKGPFGYGWTSSFSDHLVVEKANKRATLVQATGGTVPFAEGSGEALTPPAWTQDTLTGSEGSGYTLTLANQTKYKFAGSNGRLESVTDRDGNATTLTYNEAGRLTTITDPAGRKIKLTYNSEGLVEAAEDPMGHVVKYTYEGGNLKSVTQPAESGLRWQYKYDSSHEITEMIDGRGGKTINEYNASHQVAKQEDPAGRKLKFEYASFRTKITNETTGSITDEYFTSNDEPSSITRGYGTSSASTESFTYNEGGYVTSVTDGNGHVTKYGYNSANDRTSMVDPDKNETKWEYDTKHDVIAMITPKGETTTIKRESHGNPEAIERPAPESKTQVTKYKYASTGELESAEDPLKRVWKYEYDAKGDRTAGIDPEGNKRTWEYNEDSQEVATVGPRGNVVGGRPAEFTTKTTRDAQGRPVAVTEQSGEFGYGFQIGTVGSENGQLKEPTGEVVTAGGNVDVVDRGNNRVEEFSAKGEYIGKFGSSGTGKGQFKSPYAIAIDSKGDLWVADEGNDRVQEFNEKHEAILMFGSEGAAGGQFKEPKSIAIAPNGDVYVSDAMNERVERFNEKGEFLAAFGWGVSDGKSEFEICKSACRAGLVGSGNGEFSQLRGVAVAANGAVWTADTVNNRIEEFNEKDEYASQFGVKGAGSGQLKEPKGVAIDAAGNVWVADSINNRVQEFTPSGGFLTAFGASGAGSGQFAEPFGIAFAASGAVYIADIKNNRVEEWASIAAVTEYKYDGDGNVEQVTDPNGHTTKYTYNGDNQPTKVEAPSKAITETEYDGAGQVVKQIDGNKHATKYARNALEEVTEVTDPLGHVTKKEYDAAGDLEKLEDPAKRTTTYTYDPANRLTEIVYSSGKPATVTYEYDKDGDRTKMVDGSGTTKYAYDQLDRLTESESGHKEVVKYEYDLGNEQSKITYPSGKAVTRAFDKDGRLEKITDWSGKETRFSYDQSSNLEATTFPSATKDEDAYTHNDADQQTEVKMKKGTETLASLAYTRDAYGQVKGITGKGLPGAEITENTYDENNRLTKYGATEYKYDAANNPTKAGASENTFNEGNELEKGTGMTYSYDELGERAKTTPSSGPATAYGYDQAGSLTSVERPKEGETPEIKDAYAYDGDGLRASQTVNGTTAYLAWDMSERIPLILGDGVNSYIYGPKGLPVEQINNTTGAVEYLHHDQAGSTRLITGSAGTVEGKCAYAAYGAPACEGTATTPLGYDAQYTNADTGLVYLRMRSYDPATAQFMSVDPAVALTRQPYTYAENNPLTFTDPRGLCGVSSANEFLESLNPVSEQNCAYEGAQAAGAAEPIEQVVTYAPVVDAAAGAGCLFSSGTACVLLLNAALIVDSVNVALQGAETCWENPGKLIAEAALNGILYGGSRAVNMAATLSGLGPLGKAGISATLTTLLTTYDASQTP